MQIEVTGRNARIASLALALISAYCLKHGDSNEFIYVLYMSSMLISCVPWLLVLRRKISKRPFSENSKWMTTAKFSLWTTLLIGPVVLVITWLWFIAATEPERRATSLNGLVVILYTIAALGAAYYIAAFAYLIQLWRDQWHQKLNIATAIFLTLLFLAFLYWAVS